MNKPQFHTGIMVIHIFSHMLKPEVVLNQIPDNGTEGPPCATSTGISIVSQNWLLHDFREIPRFRYGQEMIAVNHKISPKFVKKTS